MKHQVIIRDLRRGDIKHILKIMAQFPDAYPPLYRNAKTRGGIVWLLNYALSCHDPIDARSFVLEVDDQIAGHIAYLRDVRCFEGGVYELRAMVLDRQYYRMGYGEDLVEYLLEELKKIKTRLVWLQTGKYSMSFWHKCGFKQIARYPNYWPKFRSRHILGMYFKETET